MTTDGALRRHMGAFRRGASLALGAGLTTVDEAAIIEAMERILHAFAPAAC